jgi:hypothetical protein
MKEREQKIFTWFLVSWLKIAFLFISIRLLFQYCCYNSIFIQDEFYISLTLLAIPPDTLFLLHSSWCCRCYIVVVCVIKL